MGIIWDVVRIQNIWPHFKPAIHESSVEQILQRIQLLNIWETLVWFTVSPVCLSNGILCTQDSRVPFRTPESEASEEEPKNLYF